MPASRSRRFITSLSMPTAEPRTPAPTKGMSAILSRPWTVPSSPNVPWRTGKTTSTGFCGRRLERRSHCFDLFDGTNASALLSRSNLIARGRSAFCSSFSSSLKYHFPFLSMPIKTTSYFFLSIASTTFLAEMREISCSADLPPKRTATRIFFLMREYFLRPMQEEGDYNFFAGGAADSMTLTTLPGYCFFSNLRTKYFAFMGSPLLSKAIEPVTPL